MTTPGDFLQLLAPEGDSESGVDFLVQESGIWQPIPHFAKHYYDQQRVEMVSHFQKERCRHY